MRPALALGALLCALAPACGGSAGDAGAPPGELLVAAASDLRFAFEELGADFERETGTRVVFTFGSSGQLARQVEEGAPFDLYASANGAFVDDVVAAGRGLAETRRTYALGRIVVWARDRELRLEELRDPSVRVLAVANPEHAPYGAAALEALESAGLLGAVRDRLVYGENVSDTHRLAASGNADAAITALSLALASDAGRWTPIAAELHEPLEQALVVTATEVPRADAARAFAELVGSAAGRATMRRYGFLLPGEEPPGD